MKNHHLWEEYTERGDAPILRVEDIVFISKYHDVKIGIREEEDANTGHPLLYYVDVCDFTDRELLRREVSTWALSTSLPDRDTKVKPFIEIYLKVKDAKGGSYSK